MKTRKQRIIPGLSILVLSLIIVLTLFFSWHDGSKHAPEVFVMVVGNNELPTDLRKASYRMPILRPGYFMEEKVDETFHIYRYRNHGEYIQLIQNSSIDNFQKRITLDPEMGRKAIHRLAIVDIKFPLTLGLLLLVMMVLKRLLRTPQQQGGLYE